jgi:O-antigen ligase
MPLAIWWALDKSSRSRWVGFAIIGILGFTVIDTGSRGGFLGIVGVFLGFLLFAIKGENKRLKKVGRVVIALGILSFPFLPADYRSTLTTIRDENDYNRTAPTGRIQVWKRGIGYALRYPVVGVGLSNFQTAEGRISVLAKNLEPGRGLKWSTAHNSYIQVAAELGLIPGFYFIALILRSIYVLTLWNRRKRKEARQKHQRGPPELPLPMFLGLSFVGYGISGFFLSFAYYDIVYVMLGMSSAVILHRTAEDKYLAKQAAAMPVPTPRKRVRGRPQGRRLAPTH